MAKTTTAKQEDLHALDALELQARLKNTQEAYFRLRFRHASNPMKNPMEIREARRSIARLKTLLRQKEVRV